MTAMTNINITRVVLGGIVAGVIIFTLAGVINGVLLRSAFESWSQGMGSRIHPPAQSISMSLWALMSLNNGIVGVWIYAGIRPRFGAGPKTALLAGFLLAMVNKLAVALDFIAVGIFPLPFVAGQLIGGFVAVLLGVFLGAWIYKE